MPNITTNHAITYTNIDLIYLFAIDISIVEILST